MDTHALSEGFQSVRIRPCHVTALETATQDCPAQALEIVEPAKLDRSSTDEFGQ